MIFMSNGLRTLLTLVLVLIAVILFNLYNFKILPWYICIIIMIFSILIYCKIVDIKKFMIDIGTRYREKEELTEYQKEQMHNEMMNNMLNEMDEDEKNEKVKFLRLFFVLIVISLIVFLILLVMGKAQIELVEAWISIMAIILGIIIIVHEFGHFIFSKMFGVYVYEFSLGMGPALFTKKGKDKETDYCIRAIPIGGFVQLAGEEVEDDKKIPKDRKLYSNPVWQRFLIMFFGAGNNFLLALLLLFIYALIWGAPVLDATVTSVLPNYPAYQAGINDGDKIVSINGHKVSTMDDAQIYLAIYNKGNKITFKMQKENGETKDYTVIPVKETVDGVNTYKFGMSFNNGTERGFFKSISTTSNNK